jgi:molecular chaperone HscB
MKCWDCHVPVVGQPFCPECGKIAVRTAGDTHFDFLGLPRTWDVDPRLLERQYRDLSLKLHPDRFGKADLRQHRLSVEQTTSLNEAYRTLKDPVRRAFYLLKLHGVDLEREDAGAQKDMPLEFLEEVMQLREDLQEAASAKDRARVQSLADDVRARQRRALEEGVAALRVLDVHPGDEQAVRKASHALGRVRYFTRFLEQVDAYEEEALEDG